MKEIKLEHSGGGTVKMVQNGVHQKVKITVRYGIIGGYDTIWATPEQANKFYNKRIADGYKRV